MRYFRNNEIKKRRPAHGSPFLVNWRNLFVKKLIFGNVVVVDGGVSKIEIV